MEQKQISVEKPYSLYQTYNIDFADKEPPMAQKKAFAENVNKLYTHQKNAIVRLILEHARINGDYVVGELPYGGKEIDGGVEYTLDGKNMPRKLKWILLSFYKLCVSES